MNELTMYRERELSETNKDQGWCRKTMSSFVTFKYRILPGIIGLILTVPMLNVQAEEAQLSVNIKRLSLESAQRIAQASIAECRTKGYQVSVTVVDRNGIPQVMLRDTLGPAVSVSISKDKAYTSANFSAPSGGLTRLKGSPLYYRDGLAMLAGGVLIQAAGQVFGAVGVSGAPDGEIDASCARAGIDAIFEDLEMGSH